MISIEFIRKVPLLSVLESKELEDLRERLVLRTFQEDEQIFLQGDVGHEMYFILEGQIRISRENSSGRELTLAIRGPNEFVGEMALLDGYPRSASGYAQGGRCRCLILTAQRFHSYLEFHPQVGRRLLGFLSARLRESADRLEDMATLTVRQRLAALLYKLATESGEDGSEGVMLPETVNYRFLSGLLGTIRETVSRAAGELTTEGLLGKLGRRFLITNFERLRQVGHGEEAKL